MAEDLGRPLCEPSGGAVDEMDNKRCARPLGACPCTVINCTCEDNLVQPPGHKEIIATKPPEDLQRTRLAMPSNHAGDVILHQPLAVRTTKSGRRRDISEHQDLASPRQRRRGGRQEFIVVEHDGTDYIEDDSAIQVFADSFGLASSDTAVQSSSGIWW